MLLYKKLLLMTFGTTYVYMNSINIPPNMIINRMYEHQNLLPLYLVSFLVGLRTYQHPCTPLERNAFQYLVSKCLSVLSMKCQYL